MNLRPDLREHAGIYLRGLMMGACDIIPGVSGGTIALINRDLRATGRGHREHRP